ncbi:MAG: class I SAM-dependent methyltransferase [candidate division Zixibacteria bacterium]|nr:class I SAM-dependent methyltransferase [candidate division Zixibacteria bacterium]
MPDVKRSWDKVARLYSHIYIIKTNTIHYGPLCPGENRLGLLGDISGLHAIDLGCGAGQNAVAMAKAGAVVTGVDFSANQLGEARKLADKFNVSIKLVNKDISNLAALKSGDFDIAISACAMAFVKDLKRALVEAFRILKTGGRFVLSVMHPVQYIIDGDERSVHFNSTYPFVPRLLKSSWDFENESVKFQHYLRSVSEYHNYLADTGFAVKKILEPKPTLKTPHLGFSREIMNEYPYIARHLPITLIFLAVKP